MKLAFAYHTMARWFSAGWDYCIKVKHSPSTRKIAIEFCTEVAVLVAVFPLLDFIIANRTPAASATQQGAGPNVTGEWVLVPWAIAAVFFIFAIIMAVGKE